MSRDLTGSELEYIVARILENANEARKERISKPDDEFFNGKTLAYYEVLDTLKNEMIVREIDLKKYGLDINLDALL